MTTLHITPADRGNVYVFLVDLPEPQAKAFAEDSHAVGEALGTTIDASFLITFPLSDLAGVGLAHYLIEGMGLQKEAVNADILTLSALRGQVVILKGDAFHGETFNATARPPLTHVGTYPETVTPVDLEPLRSEAAIGQLAQGKPPKSNARVSGMVATLVLLFLAVFVTIVVLAS